MTMDLEALRKARSAAQIRFDQADNAWSKKLPKVPNARYLPIGKGDPGTSLRKLYDARESAREAWEHASEKYRDADLQAFRKSLIDAATKDLLASAAMSVSTEEDSETK